ncbi:hypothetical protein GS506_28895 [Rhodococcus hoagii]|nr:hypothetical protein [Prescottella equi]
MVAPELTRRPRNRVRVRSVRARHHTVDGRGDRNSCNAAPRLRPRRPRLSASPRNQTRVRFV